jgi:glutaredoxin 3
MPRVVMYTSQVCPFCIRAKRLLQSKDVELEEIRIDRDRKQRRIMIERTRRHTVPQIYIDDFHVGGFQDLAALDAHGDLDRLLGR